MDPFNRLITFSTISLSGPQCKTKQSVIFVWSCYPNDDLKQLPLNSQKHLVLQINRIFQIRSHFSGWLPIQSDPASSSSVFRRPDPDQTSPGSRDSLRIDVAKYVAIINANFYADIHLTYLIKTICNAERNIIL